eukprot:222714_1
MSTTEWQRLLIVIGIIVILNIWIGYEISTFPIHNPTNNIFQRNNTKESHQSTKNLIKQNSHCLNHIYDAIFVISIPIRHETLSITSAQLISENINFILWKGHSADNPHSVELWNIYRNNWKHVPDHWGNSVYKQLNIFLLRQTDIDIIHYSLKKNFSKILILEDDILLADTYWFQLFCKIEPNLPEWYILNLGINNILYDVDNFNQSNFFQHENVSNFENSKMKYYQTPYNAFGAFAISFSYKMYQIMLDIYDMDSKPGMRSDLPMDSFQDILPVVSHNMNISDKLLNINPTLFLPDVTKSMIRSEPMSMDNYIKTHTSDNDNSRFSKYWKLRFGDKPLKFDYSPSQPYLRNNRLLHSR